MQTLLVVCEAPLERTSLQRSAWLYIFLKSKKLPAASNRHSKGKRSRASATLESNIFTIAIIRTYKVVSYRSRCMLLAVSLSPRIPMNVI